MIDKELYIYSEKYRPTTIAECILPTAIKNELQGYVDKGNLPNLILSGPPGLGKTTSARALVEQIGGDCMIINASLNGNIDTLRNEIQSFASSVSLTGGLKVIIFDEGDGLTHNAQTALRGFMQEFSHCRFIFTCNFINKIIEPIRESRLVEINFKIDKGEKQTLAIEFLGRACEILDLEGIEYDKKAVAGVIAKHFPDWRKVLNELQRYSTSGRIDSGILTNATEETIKTLIGYLAERDFTNMRRWVGENSDIDQQALFRNLYDNAINYMDKNSIPQLVIHIAKYQFQGAFVADHEINLAACLTELMMDISFKC